MWPLLRDGDVVRVAPSPPANLAIGDVVCYDAPDRRLFLHRLVERRAADVVVKGDALSYHEVVSAVHVLGRAVAVERRARLARLDTRGARARGRVLGWLAPPMAALLDVALRAGRGWSARAGA